MGTVGVPMRAEGSVASALQEAARKQILYHRTEEKEYMLSADPKRDRRWERMGEDSGGERMTWSSRRRVSRERLGIEERKKGAEADRAGGIINA